MENLSHLETNLFSSIFWKPFNFNIKIQDQFSPNQLFRNDTSNLGEVDHYFHFKFDIYVVR